MSTSFDFWTQFIGQSITAGTLGAAVSWYFNAVLAERAKKAIHHEYDQKLKTHESKLSEKLQTLRLDHERNQKRTELFFNHQREAFQELLAHISGTLVQWDSTYEWESRVMDPAPSDRRIQLQQFMVTHALFLDEECLAVLNLIVRRMTDSLPLVDGGGETHYRDPEPCYDDVKFILPRLGRIFQRKLGVSSNVASGHEIGIVALARFVRTRNIHPTDDTVAYMLTNEIGADSYVLPLIERLPQVVEFANQHLGVLKADLFRNQFAIGELSECLTLLLQVEAS